MNQLEQIEWQREQERRERQELGQRMVLLHYQLVARWIGRARGIDLELSDEEVGHLVMWVGMQEVGLERELATESTHSREAG